MRAQSHKTEIVLFMLFLGLVLAFSVTDSLRSPAIITGLALVYYLTNIIYARFKQQLSISRVVEVGAAAFLGMILLLYFI